MRIKQVIHIVITIAFLLLPDLSKAIKGLKNYKRHEYNSVLFYVGPAYNLYKGYGYYGNLNEENTGNFFEPKSGGINLKLRQFNGRGFISGGLNIQQSKGTSTSSPDLEWTRFISGTDSIDTNNDGTNDSVENIYDSTSVTVATGPAKAFEALVITLSLGYYSSNFIKQPHWNKSAIIPSVGFGLSVSSESFKMDTINTSTIGFGLWAGIQLEKQITKSFSINIYGKGTAHLSSNFLTGVAIYGVGLEYFLD